MTPEEFAELVVEGDAAKIADAAASWSEAERRKLWKGLSRVLGTSPFDSRGYSNAESSTPAFRAIRELSESSYGLHCDAVGVAVLAIGPLSQARKCLLNDPSVLKASVKILSDRRPEWIDQWVDSYLESSDRRFSLWWNLLRPLIRQGICRKPTSDAYIVWMSQAAQFERDGRLLSQRLADDPDLLEDVWRILEIEDAAPWTYSEKYAVAHGYEDWPTALNKLAEQGLLDRQRLLDSCLKTLSMGFKDTVLTNYVRFYNELRPSPDELLSRQRTFVDLLANPSSRVVTFALEKLGEIEDAGQFDGEAFLAVMTPVFHLRTKGQAKTALKLAARLVEKEARLLPHAVAGVLEAFSHPAVEVQQQAVALIESWAPRLHHDHATTIRQRLEALAPSVRPRAEGVVNQIRPGSESLVEPPAGDGFPTKLEALAREAAALPSPWRERAGVDEALESLRAGRLPRALMVDLLETRLLTGVAPIRPIQTADELIDTVAHAFETFDSADELERILDGISRLGDQRPPDFQRRTDPLAKRLADSHAVDELQRTLAWDDFAKSLYRLTMAWLSESPSYSEDTSAGLNGFFYVRTQEIARTLQKGRPRPLLAAPTHEGGWIDPMVFVRRLADVLESGDEPGRFDLIQALLRLAPDDRDKALEAAGDVPGHVGRAVRWALGGTEGPIGEDNSHTALWLAAGRARRPAGALDDLPNLKITDGQPDGVLPARYSWRPNKWNDAERRWSFLGSPLIKITVEPEPPVDGVASSWPTVALHQRYERAGYPPIWQCGFPSAWHIGVVRQVWPLCLGSFLIAAIHALAARLEMPSSTLAPNHEYLRPWFEPDRPWSELAAVAIWIALVSKDPGSRTTALDVLIEAVVDGRACPRQMSDVLLRMLPGNWVKLNRVAAALAETARTSAAHAWFVSETLQTIVAGMDAYPRDTHCLLSLLHELLADLGLALAPDARRRSEELPGTGKTKTMAVALRKLEPQPEAVKRREAGMQFLEARIHRAQRWSASRDPSGEQ